MRLHNASLTAIQLRTYKDIAAATSARRVGAPGGRWLAFCATALGLFAATAHRAPADEAETRPPFRLRRYDKGPLTADDFRAKIPKPVPVVNGVRLLAFTTTHIRFQHRYTVTTRGAGRIATLTSIDVFAAVLPDESWNANPTNKSLLDHEQGHFDITAIQAGRAHLAFLRKIRGGEPPVGAGADDKQAIADLDQKLHAVIRAATKDWKQAQVRYDKVTRHGSDAAAQLRERRQQLGELSVVRRAVQQAAKQGAGR